jgi:putative transposase
MKTELGYTKLRKRVEYEGHARYLTFSCFKSQPFLNSDRTRTWLLNSIEATRAKKQFDLWAWVIMPEHAHLLILPKVPVAEILSSIKMPVARLAAAWVRKNAPDFLPRMTETRRDGKTFLRFWQCGGGYDRNIYSYNELLEKIKYIHRNPTRRELVKTAEEWKWSSSKAWQDGVNEPLAIDKDSFPLL